MLAALAYRGVGPDHLLLACPALNRAMEADPTGRYGTGEPLYGLVDVDGSDLCGWCVRVYKARNR